MTQSTFQERQNGGQEKVTDGQRVDSTEGEFIRPISTSAKHRTSNGLEGAKDSVEKGNIFRSSNWLISVSSREGNSIDVRHGFGQSFIIVVSGK